MNTIYFPSVVIIALLFYYFYKRESLNKEQDASELTKEIHPDDINNIKPEIATQTVADANLEIKPEIIAKKNSWLYPPDDCGKLEKGVVADSVTYLYELNENKKDVNDLVILSEKKTFHAKRKKFRGK